MALKTILKTAHLQIKVICIGNAIEIHIIDLQSHSENITRVGCDELVGFIRFLGKIRIIGIQLGSGRFQQSHRKVSIPHEVVTERVSATGRVDSNGNMTYKFTLRSTLVDTNTNKTIFESRCVAELPYDKAKAMAEALRDEMLVCCRPRPKKKK